MYIDPIPPSIAALVGRGLNGPVRMLNLLRFRDEADYSASPDLAPEEPVSGAAAYATYSAHTIPLLTDVGGRVVFVGEGGPLLIGPPDTRWDQVLIVEYPGIDAFLAMIRDPRYAAGAGHRRAALADARLLPMQ